MKNFYDKLLLLLAVLALLGGGAYYYLNSGKASTGSSDSSTTGGSEAYQAIPIPQSAGETAEWPAPEPQPAGKEWLYDVFTPPKIYIDKNGEFTAIPPGEEKAPQPYGIYLSAFLQKPYRVQIQGFSGDRTKPKECVLFLFDEERQVRFFIRPGQTNEEAEIEVQDFVINSEIDPATNTVTVTVFATVLDKRTGKTVKLVDGERLLEEKATIILKSKEDLTFEIENPKVGDRFETTLGSYLLKQINLEDKSVTVEKQATEETEAITRTFFVEEPAAPATTQPETEEVPADSGDFDLIF